MSDYETIYSNDNPESPAYAWIQWKGTDICMDIHCICGTHGHFDGDFAYSLKCIDCGREYATGQNIKLIPLDSVELKSANGIHFDYKLFGEDL
jgi:hypothetical protein